MRHSSFVLATLAGFALLACSDSKKPTDPATPVPSASVSVSSLERPGVLPRPPTSGLPSDLRPPKPAAK